MPVADWRQRFRLVKQNILYLVSFHENLTSGSQNFLDESNLSRSCLQPRYHHGKEQFLNFSQQLIVQHVITSVIKAYA